MSGASIVVFVAGLLGLIGTLATALLGRQTGSETLGLQTLELALKTQGEQLDRQGTRIDELEAEVRSCHDERARDRATYRAELSELRAQIGAKP
jgi:hypothetical protein